MSSLREISSRPPGAPVVYLFPHAGGSASEYRALTDVRGVGWTAVQLRGRGARFTEEPLDTMSEIVADVVPDLTDDIERHGSPYAFFGHSFGALLAFEVVREIGRRGCRPPARLWLSSFPAPDRIPTEPLLGMLGDEELLDVLDERFGAIPAEVREHPELAAIVARYLRSDYRAIEGYDPPDLERVSPDVTACYGTDDGEHPDEVLQWRRWCSGAFGSLSMPGGHFYLYDLSNAETLGRGIAEAFGVHAARA